MLLIGEVCVFFLGPLGHPLGVHWVCEAWILGLGRGESMFLGLLGHSLGVNLCKACVCITFNVGDFFPFF
jgi:hypothetical protein